MTDKAFIYTSTDQWAIINGLASWVNLIAVLQNDILLEFNSNKDNDRVSFCLRLILMKTMAKLGFGFGEQNLYTNVRSCNWNMKSTKRQYTHYILFFLFRSNLIISMININISITNA